ncbi:aldo/keto reductase [Curtobacterium sp. MCBD17_032]|uniref:aldo/keto reductase n=1 Tax=Curtobacterium sp. MCBD17_032 TaxID=2175659 RepID=UPI002815EB71|nr:aldo/keto reductase [Curtobacterium sp. MCBD17_032]
MRRHPEVGELVRDGHQDRIRHLGVSNATVEQVEEAQAIAPIVSVQNMYNLANRHDDELVDRLARRGSPTSRSSRSAGSGPCRRTP